MNDNMYRIEKAKPGLYIVRKIWLDTNGNRHTITLMECPSKKYANEYKSTIISLRELWEAIAMFGASGNRVSPMVSGAFNKAKRIIGI